MEPRRYIPLPIEGWLSWPMLIIFSELAACLTWHQGSLYSPTPINLLPNHRNYFEVRIGREKTIHLQSYSIACCAGQRYVSGSIYDQIFPHEVPIRMCHSVISTLDSCYQYSLFYGNNHIRIYFTKNIIYVEAPNGLRLAPQNPLWRSLLLFLMSDESYCHSGSYWFNEWGADWGCSHLFFWLLRLP